LEVGISPVSAQEVGSEHFDPSQVGTLQSSIAEIDPE
jgi:hypothetical protein